MVWRFSLYLEQVCYMTSIDIPHTWWRDHCMVNNVTYFLNLWKKSQTHSVLFDIVLVNTIIQIFIRFNCISTTHFLWGVKIISQDLLLEKKCPIIQAQHGFPLNYFMQYSEYYLLFVNIYWYLYHKKFEIELIWTFLFLYQHQFSTVTVQLFSQVIIKFCSYFTLWHKIILDMLEEFLIFKFEESESLLQN